MATGITFLLKISHYYSDMISRYIFIFEPVGDCADAQVGNFESASR